MYNVLLCCFYLHRNWVRRHLLKQCNANYDKKLICKLYSAMCHEKFICNRYRQMHRFCFLETSPYLDMSAHRGKLIYNRSDRLWLDPEKMKCLWTIPNLKHIHVCVFSKEQFISWVCFPNLVELIDWVWFFCQGIFDWLGFISWPISVHQLWIKIKLN